MSEQAPEGGRRPPARGGGNVLTRPFLGAPGWVWVVGLAAAVGAYVFIRSRNAAASSSTSTTQGVTDTSSAADDTTALSEYEQVNADLVGIQGTQEALLAAVKDLQGDESKEGGGKKPVHHHHKPAHHKPAHHKRQTPAERRKEARQDERQARRKRVAGRKEARQDKRQAARRNPKVPGPGTGRRSPPARHRAATGARK